MRQLALLSLLMVMLGSGCSPEPKAAAVGVDVTYSFRTGCITVHARDATAPDREDLRQVQVPPQRPPMEGPPTVHFAVFRKEDWSRTLELTIAARERSCDGNVMATEVHTVELPKEGIQRLAITFDVPDEDNDDYMPTSIGGTDCDDGDVTINPGMAEDCDTRDNNCNGQTDEGVLLTWYPDADTDSYGDQAAPPLTSCEDPSGTTRYVQNKLDCQDSDATIYPRDSTFLETRCDEVDNDCDGTVDDGFPLKGVACVNPCAGQFVCDVTRTTLTCNSPAQNWYYADADGDGAGVQSKPFPVCPEATPPAGTVANTDDCDDQDPHNRRGGTETCDGRDNTCDENRDENNACMGKGARERLDAELSNRNWRTVALSPDGTQVWLAGLNGVLAVSTNAGRTFTSKDGSCDSRNWRAAWVRPSDGHVFLVGESGYLAQHTGKDCINKARVGSQNNLRGIIGFESNSNTELYAVDLMGKMYLWVPGNAPLELFVLASHTLFDIHGLMPSQLLAAGGTSPNPSMVRIAEYSGTSGSAVRAHTLNLPQGYTGRLRAVWMGAPKLAYAVGDNGLVMKWDGERSWDVVDPPVGAENAAFTSVGMLDAHSIYVTDMAGRIYLRTSSRWLASPLFVTHQPIRDIAMVSPTEIWAVGNNGLVLHFAE
jgi:hypothetical protein